jgi:predicted transcriptional regulator YdeE
MEPQLIACPAMTVLGIEVTTSNAAERDPAHAKLPRLWSRFFGEDVLSTVPGKRPPVHPLGVYTDYESDQHGRYRVVAGAVVEAGTAQSERLGRATVPAGDYLVFKGKGPMPDVVRQVWEAVWNHFSSPGIYIRAYTADVERYVGPDEVEILVAVKPVHPNP